VNGLLWLESEVAERLRTTETRIRHLRRSGQLGYYPGPPILISDEHIAEYLRARERKAKPNAVTSREEEFTKRAAAFWKKHREQKAEKERKIQLLQQAQSKAQPVETKDAPASRKPFEKRRLKGG